MTTPRRSPSLASAARLARRVASGEPPWAERGGSGACSASSPTPIPTRTAARLHHPATSSPSPPCCRRRPPTSASTRSRPRCSPATRPRWTTPGPTGELEELIRPTGFYRDKADSLIGLGAAVVEKHDGDLPHTLDELVALPGIGRKTANVILGNAFDIPGITVDTHFGRLVRRWGWTAEDDPVKVEHAVGELVPRRDWTIVSHG